MLSGIIRMLDRQELAEWVIPTLFVALFVTALSSCICQRVINFTVTTRAAQKLTLIQ